MGNHMIVYRFEFTEAELHLLVSALTNHADSLIGRANASRAIAMRALMAQAREARALRRMILDNEGVQS